MKAVRSHDRRGVGRPRNGDTKPCPNCGKATCEFNDRYRFEGSIIPAWVCDSPQCRHREVVRRITRKRAPSSPPAVAAAKKVQEATRGRSIRKATARESRVQKGIAKAATPSKPK